MNKIKKVCSLALASAILLLTTACGSGETLEIVKKEDIANLKISVQAGTIGESLAKELVGEGKEADALVAKAKSDTVMALTSKKVGAALMDMGPAKQFVDKDSTLMILPDQYDIEQYALAIKKGNTELLEKVDALVAKAKADGVIADLQEKYATTEVKAADIDLNIGASGGILTLGTNAGFPPYEMREGDGYVGIDIEIGAYIAKELDMELKVEDMDFDALPLALDTGRIDFIAAGMTVTPERELTTDFTQPYIEDARQVIVIRVEDFGGESK